MKCPHCTVSFHDKEQTQHIGTDVDGLWFVGCCTCSACGRIVVRLINRYSNDVEIASYLVRPKTAGRPPISPDVPNKYAEDYNEACLVLADSPKASAALSRRCLQLLLRDESKVKPQDLYSEIQEILDRDNLPSHIAESIDAVRNIGNFA